MVSGGATTAVLSVRVMGFDAQLKIVLGERVVSLGDDGLLLPFHHFGLVEDVGVVHLFRIELEFVLVRDCDVGAHE